MSDNQTVNIGGRSYDAYTGLSVDPVTPRVTHPAGQIHTSTQHSQTLNRHSIKKPVAPARPIARVQQHAVIKQSPAISRFAPHPQMARSQAPVMDIRARKPRPMASKVVTPIAPIRPVVPAPKPVAATPKPSEVIKREAIASSLEQAPSHAAGAKPVKRAKKQPRVLSIVSASLALILLAGYLTYLNMPSLSVRVAAAQAGINASYPAYHPDGYSLNGTVTYKEGEVAMRFTSNAGPQDYTLTQQRSSWDSTAVQEDIASKTNGQYLTDVQRGVTIYTYGGNAAWVSGGILYTIDGTAPLSRDQITHIASSL